MAFSQPHLIKIIELNTEKEYVLAKNEGKQTVDFERVVTIHLLWKRRGLFLRISRYTAQARTSFGINAVRNNKEERKGG